MKKVIITGPTGAIGVALINELISRGVYVTAVCHRNSARINNIPKSEYVDIIQCELSDLKTDLEGLPSDYNVFFHFAWACTTGVSRDNINAQIDNIKYTIDAVEVAHKLGCKKFIGAGSQAEYGRVEGKLKPDTPANPENGYGIAKLCAGQLSRIRCKQLGIQHIWTRILSVYGPFDGEKTMINQVINTLLEGRKPSCTKGEQVWDYIYSKDIAVAFRLIAEKGKSDKTYCIGSGKGCDLKQYINIIRDLINPHLEIGFGDISYAENQVMHLCADISELTKDTGFIPRYSFDEGIQETIGWIKGKKNEKN